MRRPYARVSLAGKDEEMVGIDELLHARQAAEKERYPERPGSRAFSR